MSQTIEEAMHEKAEQITVATHGGSKVLLHFTDQENDPEPACVHNNKHGINGAGGYGENVTWSSKDPEVYPPNWGKWCKCCKNLFEMGEL